MSELKAYTEEELAEHQQLYDEVFTPVWESEGQYCRAGGGQYEKSFAWWAFKHQQSKVDELRIKLNGAEERALTCIKYKDKYLAERDGLQKENAALVHVVKSRDIQLENEKHEYDGLMNKLVDSGMKNTELQKRVDALIQKYKDEDRELKLIDEWEKSQIYGLVASELEQVLKGGRE